MTKYEWEHELKKNIHRLPADEIARVLDYYNEMFEDNIERGKSEREIIREFGNPVDVADKILSEYDGELLPIEGDIPVPRPPEDKPADGGIFDGHDNNKCDDTIADKSVKDTVEQKKNEQNEYDKLDEVDKRNVKVALFLVVNFVTGFAFVIVAAVAWIVLAAFTVAGVGMGLGGAYAFIVSFGPMFTGGFGAGLAQLGISIALVGLGVILVVGCVKSIRTYAKVTKTLYNGIFKVSKEERV
ncbi:MAG: DUF1700 domain-containing protein [Clostridiales bacterium]|nr:DUF1700 domain-containing protein [Clostridiales bacterium]